MWIKTKSIHFYRKLNQLLTNNRSRKLGIKIYEKGKAKKWKIRTGVQILRMVARYRLIVSLRSGHEGLGRSRSHDLRRGGDSDSSLFRSWKWSVHLEIYVDLSNPPCSHSRVRERRGKGIGALPNMKILMYVTFLVVFGVCNFLWNLLPFRSCDEPLSKFQPSATSFLGLGIPLRKIRKNIFITSVEKNWSKWLLPLENKKWTHAPDLCCERCFLRIFEKPSLIREEEICQEISKR